MTSRENHEPAPGRIRVVVAILLAAKALKELPATERKTIDQMWVGVRAIGGKQVCVDFASFPALYHAAPEVEKVELGGPWRSHLGRRGLAEGNP